MSERACPNCGYTDDGDDGDFFELPVKVERENEYNYGYGEKMGRRTLFACPKCRKTFIGEYDQ